MSAIPSTPRFLPPISPRRAPSPAMSPGRRPGRTGASDEPDLRDLSPTNTLRAFTEKPMPFDTTRDEYKIFACIETLTPAERELGARVAKAAQRLRSWCEEIDQWGWTGNFQEPSKEYREQRRRSVEAHIREHVKASDEAIASIGPLDYWGSLLSVEVEAHEARLDEISEELLTLDIEELKGHVLDIHGPNKSRPSSAGYEATRQNYTLMDDFSIILTQTLVSALPHHYQLGERLSTWTARVSILREAPRYVADLKTSQKAMQLGWEAIEPPTDLSDTAFNKWKDAVDTISGVLHGKVGDMGQRLDRMLDTLEGRDDCLPDEWIDNFEGLEADYGRWAHESRRRVIEFDIRRKAERNGVGTHAGDTSAGLRVPPDGGDATELAKEAGTVLASGESAQASAPASALIERGELSNVGAEPSQPSKNDGPVDEHIPIHSKQQRSVTAHKTPIYAITRHEPEPEVDQDVREVTYEAHPIGQLEDLSPVDDFDDLVFDEGDTVVHNDLEDIPEDDGSSTPDMTELAQNVSDVAVPLSVVDTQENVDVQAVPHEPLDSMVPFDRPQTPTSRRGSVGSISSSISYHSSPIGGMEDSPSVRNTANRQSKPPPPALNAAMAKRRPAKNLKDLLAESAPWPPTQFSKQTSTNSVEDLERKISDILTTIPAHIRLTSGPEADAREIKAGKVTHKGSKGYLRASRSISGMKSPELTLSPAKQDFDSANAASGRRSAAAPRGDNDIKLYHLTQPGKEHPQKLYIRRVGENGERVMVRVGGGWSDLGEYLRHYAEHHGRRAVSEGKFEILGLEVRNQEASPRPESAMSKRDRRLSGGPRSPTSTPQKAAGVSIATEEMNTNVPGITTTPAAISSETSAPSTSSSRHSWTGNEVGLAGPKAKKLDLTGEKLEWVEGMLNKARTASGNFPSGPTRSEHTPKDSHTDRAESRSESRTGNRQKPNFGDLGKVGGTKRVFMKGGGLAEY
ncbi:hypothetical protein BCR34DRAFT_571449 [Clohesyomyces aquaticus]|uniref:GAR domain-containing protein n=1 Tax=Clohesyomyces aquaticus TaxID=1231657 RepID=A0A1Y1Z7P0_9PLEO|nr:hypothetical protein BCR34DRAFT_571449 [Clohesyomyces aquaticus]